MHLHAVNPLVFVYASSDICNDVIASWVVCVFHYSGISDAVNNVWWTEFLKMQPLLWAYCLHTGTCLKKYGCQDKAFLLSVCSSSLTIPKIAHFSSMPNILPYRQQVPSHSLTHVEKWEVFFFSFSCSPPTPPTPFPLTFTLRLYNARVGGVMHITKQCNNSLIWRKSLQNNVLIACYVSNSCPLIDQLINLSAYQSIYQTLNPYTEIQP